MLWDTICVSVRCPADITNLYISWTSIRVIIVVYDGSIDRHINSYHNMYLSNKDKIVALTWRSPCYNAVNTGYWRKTVFVSEDYTGYKFQSIVIQISHSWYYYKSLYFAITGRISNGHYNIKYLSIKCLEMVYFTLL